MKLIEDTKRLILSRYPRFGSDIAKASIIYVTDDPTLKTASTDGKNIYVNPTYFASLSKDDKMFLIAHEFMHIKFGHIHRMVDKNGQPRNSYLWNIATDAIINANLERDGFKIKEGYVNRPDALNYTAEEYYELLLREDKKNNQQNQNNQQSNQQQNNGQSTQQNSEQKQHTESDHSRWNQNSQNKTQNQTNTSEAPQAGGDGEQDERQEFEQNRDERKSKAKQKLERMRQAAFAGLEKQALAKKLELENLGTSKKEIDWRLLLRREIEKTETIWTQRRSIAENNYAYRLEENDVEEEAMTEAMIDISGSVEPNLVRAFLRIVKQLIKHSTLKVGFFNDKAHNFVEIKYDKDIDNLTIQGGGGTNYNIAVRAFTKKSEINKIIFTDGGEGIMPTEDLKKESVLWIVYGNKNFNPCCGKVIHITREELIQINAMDNETSSRTR